MKFSKRGKGSKTNSDSKAAKEIIKAKAKHNESQLMVTNGRRWKEGEEKKKKCSSLEDI